MEDKNAKTYKNLRIFNAVMGFFHLVQATLMLLVSNDFTLPVTSSFLKYNQITGAILPVNKELFQLKIGPLVAGFLFISAIAHFLLTLPVIYKWYIKNLKKKINFARWYEYAFSSSLMIIVIGMLSGIYDVGALILLFALNATMILFGLMMELHNQSTKRTNWT